MHIFNRNRLKQHRTRAASTINECDFLLREMAERLADRLADVNRSFPLALDLGAHHGVMTDVLEGRGDIGHLVQADLSEAMIRKTGGLRVVADEEALPFAENNFDLVMSCGSLHWVNDLPGTLIQIQKALKPDGLFLAILPGGETLKELRQSFEQTEMQMKGGVSPRISPFVDVRDAGSLLQRAGFALPVVDSDVLTVEYEHPLKLLADLRGMGETSALSEGNKHFISRTFMMAVMEHYTQHFVAEEGRVRASFELVTMTGWKPHESQQQPAKRGSGKMFLGDALQ